MEPTPDQVAAFERREAAIAQAAALPLPGPALEAFLAAPAVLAGHRLVPLLAYHFVLLQAIDSPLLKLLAELSKPAEERTDPPFSADEAIETLYLFTRPPSEGRAAVVGPGAAMSPDGRCIQRDRFRQIALEAVGYNLTPPQMEELKPGLVRWFLAQLATHLTYEAPPKEGAVFTEPAGAAATASAGGFTSSPGSPALSLASPGQRS